MRHLLPLVYLHVSTSACFKQMLYFFFDTSLFPQIFFIFHLKLITNKAGSICYLIYQSCTSIPNNPHTRLNLLSLDYCMFCVGVYVCLYIYECIYLAYMYIYVCIHICMSYVYQLYVVQLPTITIKSIFSVQNIFIMLPCITITTKSAVCIYDLTIYVIYIYI